MKGNITPPAIITEEATPYTEESRLDFLPLNCQILPSSLTCLVGPHRAQLRAYLLMLAGISKPESGKVVLFGQEISKFDQLAWRQFRCQVGYHSGSSPLLSEQHALMNVMLPLLYHVNVSFCEAADRARELLTGLNCHFETTVYPAQLNSFQRSQIALARALILDPQLLILDVPFNDLGAHEREEMGILLGRYKENRAVCMIGGLQYPHFLEHHANRIIFISENKILSFQGWSSFIQTEDSDVNELLSVILSFK